MKTFSERLKVRMQKDRPMTTISLRLPQDVIDEMKEMAPLLGYSGYQPMIRSYIGQGLRKDEELFDRPEMKKLDSTLRKHGLGDEAIAEVIALTLQKSA